MGSPRYAEPACTPAPEGEEEYGLNIYHLTDVDALNRDAGLRLSDVRTYVEDQ
jgi:hypothetical protein